MTNPTIDPSTRFWCTLLITSNSLSLPSLGQQGLTTASRRSATPPARRSTGVRPDVPTSRDAIGWTPCTENDLERFFQWE